MWPKSSTKATNKSYFEWLANSVGIEKYPGYRAILKLLHRVPFTSLVPHDDNRISDGIFLREEFLELGGDPIYYNWNGGASTLEVLIALTKRLVGLIVIPREDENELVKTWFWELIKNLRLDPHLQENTLHNRIVRFVTRKYSYDGSGGVFPLKRPKKDQRNVELWFQMQDYIAERFF